MRGGRKGFTLIELLAAIGIIAGLLVVAGVYIGGYIGEARRRADAQTLTVLNDAITRYKTQGGGTSGFTLGAPIGNILSRLQQPLNWNGLSHQVMKTGTTYPARSLKATGSGSAYRFYQYNSFTEKAPAASDPTSDKPYGDGVGYIALGGVNASMGIYMTATSSTGYWALKIGSGTPTIYASNAWAMGVGGGSSGTFWACAGAADSTATGSLTAVNCNGQDNSNYNVNDIDFRGLSNVQNLYCYHNKLTSINLTGLNSLRDFRCSSNQLTSLNLSGLNNLQQLFCHYNQLTSLIVNGLASLTSLYCYQNQLNSLDLTGAVALSYLSCTENLLTSITWPDAPGLLTARVLNNAGLTGSTSAINALYATLPNLSGGATNTIYLGTGAPSATDATATGKGWTVSRTN